MKAIRAIGVVKTFRTRGTETRAVRDVTLDVRMGEVLLLVGPSGSGKSTLLTLLAGLVEPTSGRVEFFGRDVAHTPPRELQALRARRIGFVFQGFRLIEALTARQNVELVLHFTGARRARGRQRANLLLERFGVGHTAYRRPSELDAEERLRVAIARAFANDPEVVIADEPTAPLDGLDALEIGRILGDAVRNDCRASVVTTSDSTLGRCADRVYHLENGMLRTPGGSAEPCASPKRQFSRWSAFASKP